MGTNVSIKPNPFFVTYKLQLFTTSHLFFNNKFKNAGNLHFLIEYLREGNNGLIMFFSSKPFLTISFLWEGAFFKRAITFLICNTTKKKQEHLPQYLEDLTNYRKILTQQFTKDQIFTILLDVGLQNEKLKPVFSDLKSQLNGVQITDNSTVSFQKLSYNLVRIKIEASTFHSGSDDENGDQISKMVFSSPEKAKRVTWSLEEPKTSGYLENRFDHNLIYDRTRKN